MITNNCFLVYFQHLSMLVRRLEGPKGTSMVRKEIAHEASDKGDATVQMMMATI